MNRQYVLVEVEALSPIADLSDHVAVKVSKIKGVKGVATMPMTTTESYGLALAQKEGHARREVGE